MSIMHPDESKRGFLQITSLIALALGCGVTKPPAESNDRQRKRFTGMGLVIVVNAVADAEMHGAAIYDDRGYAIYGPMGKISKGNRGIRAINTGRVPLSVRAIWREKPIPVWGENGGIDYEGIIVGDYTIPVAERIPDEILNDLRTRRGNLRLKFRLKPDGILFGWDIERASALGEVSIFERPGGDFLETRY